MGILFLQFLHFIANSSKYMNNGNVKIEENIRIVVMSSPI